ncbi:hypothetical protein CBM2614_B70104 [Cupriavidus taiwanensis]|nr:hypothetical protein CBM2614_B70104 [Cupriavidus taiwanensis]
MSFNPTVNVGQGAARGFPSGAPPDNGMPVPGRRILQWQSSLAPHRRSEHGIRNDKGWR